MTEADLQNLIRIALGTAPHLRLFRNNAGVAFHRDGSRVAYGVGGPGGSDLIGWTTITVPAELVGARLAVFTAVEVKTPTGRVLERQKRFLEAVRAFGGIGEVVRSEDEARRLLRVSA